MTFSNINVGTAPNDGTGDALRDAMIIVNDNFDKVKDTFESQVTTEQLEIALDNYVLTATYSSQIASLTASDASLQSQVDNRALLIHTHSIAQVNGLLTQLNTKVNTSTYNSDISNINGNISSLNDLINNLSVVNLPVPKVKLIQNESKPIQYVLKDEGDSADIISGNPNDVIILQGYPIVTSQDFTQEQIDNSYIFLEMVHYSRQRSSTHSNGGAGYVIAGANLKGDDVWSLPWSENSSTRGRLVQAAPGGSQLFARRQNYLPVTARAQVIKAYEMLNNRFHLQDVIWRSLSEDENHEDILVPSVGYSRAGKNKATSMFPYSAYLTPYYVAFRYIQYLPDNDSVISGPLSNIVKIIHKNHPFVKSGGLNPTATLSNTWEINKNHFKCFMIDKP